MLKSRQAAFFPTTDPSNKPNCKLFYRVERDGSVTKRAFLDVPNVYERERLIAMHYLRHMIKHFWKTDIALRELGRDDPWDFTMELSSGVSFNIEVTSVADSTAHFKINKSEERFAACLSHERIPLHELSWLAKSFTGSELSELVEAYYARGVQANEMVDNPLKRSESRIFLSSMSDPEESLEDQLRAVIEKKVKKRHGGKDRTVLIIDNRTSAYDVVDYVGAAKALRQYLASLPFPEVWFYTGYFSDHSGSHAEFSFSPLKVTDEQALVLESMANEAGVSDGDRVIW